MSKGRLEAFSDGVFAIAITLLVLEIAVPHLNEPRELGQAILDLWPSYIAYATSFLTIGIMVILIGGAAALMVLAQMLHELPERAPADASAVAH